jgi:hypothetical protein
MSETVILIRLTEDTCVVDYGDGDGEATYAIKLEGMRSSTHIVNGIWQTIEDNCNT